MPVNAFNGTHNWGYDGVDWFAVHEPYGGPDGVPALRRRLPRARASASSRTSSTTTSARRATTCRCSAPTSRPGATPGATWSTSTARAATRCAGSSSTTSGCGSRTTTSTALRLDAVHALVDTSPVAHPRGDGDRDRGAVGPPAAAADADRRVRPQRHRAGHAARGAAATGSTPSGATTSTTPCTSR